MSEKLKLSQITGGNNIATLNGNFDKLVEVVNEQMLSRVVDSDSVPNQMGTDLDMNGNHIYNLPFPTSRMEPLTREAVETTLAILDKNMDHYEEANQILQYTIDSAQTTLQNKLDAEDAARRAEEAAGIAGGGTTPLPRVNSFNGRTGAVAPMVGDYDKNLVGLSSVDNTSDIDKPISTAQGAMNVSFQTQIDAITSTGPGGDPAFLLNRANHTGEQGISTVTGLQNALDGKVDKVAGKALSANDYTTVEKSKLTNIAEQATKNEPDSQLRARSTHTGEQAIATVTGLQAALDDKVVKVAGKGLSTEDYTTTDKDKLFGVASGAQVNVATNLSLGAATATTQPVNSSTGGGITLPAATTTAAGLMASADKAKLNGIATGSTANATDAQLRDRSTHTGKQLASTISNVVGTVSQSGGVPTGAIIQRGSNANGEFVRWADGTQICFSPILTVASSTYPPGSAQYMPTGWTYPMAFLNDSVHLTSQLFASWGYDFYVFVEAPGASTANNISYKNIGDVARTTAFSVRLRAEGRWF